MTAGVSPQRFPTYPFARPSNRLVGTFDDGAGGCAGGDPGEQGRPAGRRVPQGRQTRPGQYRCPKSEARNWTMAATGCWGKTTAQSACPSCHAAKDGGWPTTEAGTTVCMPGPRGTKTKCSKARSRTWRQIKPEDENREEVVWQMILCAKISPVDSARAQLRGRLPDSRCEARG